MKNWISFRKKLKVLSKTLLSTVAPNYIRLKSLAQIAFVA